MTKSAKDILSELCPLTETQFFWSAYTNETKDAKSKTGLVVSAMKYHEGFAFTSWRVVRNVKPAFDTLIRFSPEGELVSFSEMMGVPEGVEAAPRGKDRHLLGRGADQLGTKSEAEAREKAWTVLKELDEQGVDMKDNDPNHPLTQGWVWKRG